LHDGQQHQRQVLARLHPHLANVRGARIQVVRRYVVKSDKNKKENDGDLHEVQHGLQVQRRRVFVLVQKHRERKENRLRAEQEAHY